MILKTEDKPETYLDPVKHLRWYVFQPLTIFLKNVFITDQWQSPKQNINYNFVWRHDHHTNIFYVIIFIIIVNFNLTKIMTWIHLIKGPHCLQTIILKMNVHFRPCVPWLHIISYIYIYNIKTSLFIKQFISIAPILSPWEHQKNNFFSDPFRGIKREHGLKKLSCIMMSTSNVLQKCKYRIQNLTFRLYGSPIYINLISASKID